MLNVRGIITGGMVVLLMGLPALSAESDLDRKAAKLFKVELSSVTYNKTVSTNNPAVASTGQQTGQQTSESLQLSGRIEFLDPSRVLGTSGEGVITQLVDGAGRDVNVPVAPSSPHRFYQAPRYTRRFTQPPQVPKWPASEEWMCRPCAAR